MVNEYLNKLHDDIISIMDEIDKICKNNSLHYYLICGSLLGAIRHKGFIPWDDDLDIVMPREDFDKFISLFNKEQENVKGFYLRWYTTESDYCKVYAKVCKENTLFKEQRKSSLKPSGIFVDVFPMDLCDGYTEYTRLNAFIIKKLKMLLWRNSLQERVDLKTLLCKFTCFFASPLLIQKTIVAISKHVKKHGKGYYSIFGSSYPLKKQTFPIEWFGEGVYLSFEGRSYKCPQNGKSVLSLNYGDDYMQVPPIDKRITHSPDMLIFSDGTVMDKF